MDNQDIEMSFARILAGEVILELDNLTLSVRNIDRKIRLRAQSVYSSMYVKAVEAGFYNEPELLDFLSRNQLWTSSDQNILDGLYKDLDELKIALFKSMMENNLCRQIRGNITSLKGKLSEYIGRRHSFDHLSCAGYATICKTRFILSESIYKNDIKISPKNLPIMVDKIVELLAKLRPSESELRSIARGESWRSIWNSSNHSAQDIFGLPAADLSEEQKSLISLSSFYDSIKEHPECPADSIINDDDMLDGWIILQRRKRESESLHDQVERQLQNSKSKNADQVFIPVKNEIFQSTDIGGNINKVASLNDEGTQKMKKVRAAKIRKEGTVDELDMPDTQRELQMAAVRAQIK